MNKKDLLNDLESFIDSDWQDVFQEFKDEEYKESISEPVMPDFPNYDEFYKIMLEASTDPMIPPKLGYLLHRILRNQSRKTSESFDNIWSLFCDPSRFRIYFETCNECRRGYSVIVALENLPRINFSGRGDIHEMRMRQERVHCSHCGTAMIVIAGTVVGLFENRRIRIDDFK